MLDLARIHSVIAAPIVWPFSKLNSMTTESDKPSIDLLISAYEEYSRAGKVHSIRCDRCGRLIEITPVGETGRALKADCLCGRYRGNMRGL